MQYDDNKLFGLVSANFSITAIASFINKATPYMDAALVVLQIVIALYTLVHIVKKSLKSHEKKNVKRLGRNRTARRNARDKRLRDSDSQKG